MGLFEIRRKQITINLLNEGMVDSAPLLLCSACRPGVAEPVAEATVYAQAQEAANPERPKAWLWVMVTTWVTVFQLTKHNRKTQYPIVLLAPREGLEPSTQRLIVSGSRSFWWFTKIHEALQKSLLSLH
jgi:hypothetical protein